MPGSLDITFAGCEASVAVSYSVLGGDSSFVSALPKNSLSDACISNLKSFGIVFLSFLIIFKNGTIHTVKLIDSGVNL